MRAAAVDHEDRTHAQVIHLDITDRKLAEEAVNSRNDRLETLAGVLAHDLRTPLNVVQGRTQLLVERVEDAVDGAAAVDGDDNGNGGASGIASELSSIRASADRIETIIGDALQLARGGFSTEEPTSEVTLRCARSRHSRPCSPRILDSPCSPQHGFRLSMCADVHRGVRVATTA
jgi:signal transduction histidine kinase